MKGENSTMSEGRKLVRELTAEERAERDREARAERERLRREQADRRSSR